MLLTYLTADLHIGVATMFGPVYAAFGAIVTVLLFVLFYEVVVVGGGGVLFCIVDIMLLCSVMLVLHFFL